MKILKWNVLVKCDPGRFFSPVTTDRYLAGITFVETCNLALPAFSPDDPVLYSFGDSCFLVHELRRAGYNAYRRPWILFSLMQRIAARRAKAWR